MTAVIEALHAPLLDDTTAKAEQLEAERVIVAAAQTGDADAFGSLFKLRATEINKYLRGLSSGDVELAADLTQDTFIRAFTKLDHFEDQGLGISPWLHKIAHNTFIDHVRLKQNGRTASIEEMTERQDNRIASAHNPEGLNTEVLHLRALIRQVLGEIKPEHAEVLAALYYEDLEIVRTAELLGIPKGTVQSRSGRGRAAFKAYAKQHGLIDDLIYGQKARKSA